jgi:tetratricopeptide (TPR) repeat protein
VRLRATFICLIFAMFALLLVLLLGTPRPTAAQDGAATPTLTKSPNEILNQAMQASDSADQAINLVNTMLQFIQVAGLIGGGLLALAATAFTLAGVRTIQEYRSELTKARSELDDMRAQLQRETEAVRGQGDRAIRALALMQLGEQQLEAKNARAALKIYEEAYQLDPTNRATNYFLGELYVQEKNLESGIEHLQHALAGEVDYPPAEAALAYALRLRGEQLKDVNERNRHYAQAEALFLKALTTDPAVRDINGESVHGVLGGMYKRQGRIEDAIRSYEAAERVTPQNSYPVVNLAVLYFLQGQVEIAQRYFKRLAATSGRLLDGNPFDYWTRFDMTMSQIALGNTEDALQHLDVAVQQVQNPRPLEIFLGDLRRLKDAPKPPPGIDELIGRTEAAIQRMQARVSG